MRDKAIYWSKIVIFSYRLAFDASVQGVPVCSIAIPFGTGKLEWWGYPMMEKFEYMCNSLDTILACDRRTDMPRHSPRYAYASRGKNWSSHGEISVNSANQTRMSEQDRTVGYSYNSIAIRLCDSAAPRVSARVTCECHSFDMWMSLL